ncbi:DUF427 domain-containing protein [Shewanella woodyi]|uniref:DUF427 domain-containing protein n=1 Tax=Shewanella woodyi TaxID=60961 RepID=UPI0007EBDCCC|nr:DUF427 domain-containing protein [Shewanella woodyi]
MKASWNGAVIARSDKTIVVEGNHYFPPDSINSDYYTPSDFTSHCPWKGHAQYYSVVVDGKINQAAAWCYPETLDAAKEIENYIAFWRGVDVEAS